MFVVSDSDNTVDSIREELERVYIAAGYLNADHGNLEIAIHLIGVAIAEMECLAEQSSRTRIRLVHNADIPDAAK